MKKLFSVLTIITACLVNQAFASSACLSMELVNWSPTSVTFTTAVDPGYIPTVDSKQKYILPGDFMAGCSSNTCDIFVAAASGGQYVRIASVPKGTRIIYNGPNQYYLDTHANVQCPG
jgi:hypothetical protein